MLCLVLAACGSDPGPGPADPAVPGAGLEDVARELFVALLSADPARVRTLQASDAAIAELFEPGFLDVVLSQRRVESRGYERIVSDWRPYREGRYQGYCARRVGPGAADLPGLRGSVAAVGELVLAGRDAAGEWAAVVRDLVRTPDGYRLVRWTVDAPRRDHFALEQWACDFGTAR
jgi:hypothetical protein